MPLTHNNECEGQPLRIATCFDVCLPDLGDLGALNRGKLTVRHYVSQFLGWMMMGTYDSETPSR
jgi:hypothetical protein